MSHVKNVTCQIWVAIAESVSLKKARHLVVRLFHSPRMNHREKGHFRLICYEH